MTEAIPSLMVPARASRERRRPRRVGSMVFVFAMIASLLVACGQEGAAESPALSRFSTAAPTAGRAMEEGAQDLPNDRQAEPTDTALKLIQNAELHLEVASYGDARSAVEAELARSGGYVSSARINHREGQVSLAVLVLRVPATSLESTLRACSELGTVVYETLTTQDITEEYYDLAARLENARKLEARVLELLATEAKELKDLLEVERELARVRETIERYEGKLRLWDGQVAMSTLSLQLITRDIYSAGKPRTLGEQISQTLSRSWQGLLMAGRGLLLVGVALLPWAIPLLLLGWLSVRLLRRLGRRLAARAKERQEALAARTTER